MNLTIDLFGVRLGDTLFAEPIVRFAKENYYPNLEVKTDFPDLFKHLDVGINRFKKTEFWASPNTWELDKDGIWHEHPFVQFFQVGKLHIQDYMSLMLLRQILPDSYKKINIPISEELKSSMLQKYPYLPDCWLIHAGYGEPKKSYGFEYWQKIAMELKKENFKLAKIGKGYKNGEDLNFGCYDITTDYSLYNKLTVMEFIAAISLCKGIITNESSPIIIAGATETKMVSILTTGHSDFIFPYRQNGSKFHNAIGLWGEKHYMTERSYAPHYKISHYVDGNIPLIVDKHLPKVEKVIEAVKSL